MWNVFEDKFIHNEIEECVVLIVMGVIREEYAPLEARELYALLTPTEIAEIERRLKK